MSRTQVRVRARVRCEIEVEVGVWDGGTSFNALKDQVKREGTNLLMSLFDPSKVTKEALRGTIVGEPHVMMYVVDEDK